MFNSIWSSRLPVPVNILVTLLVLMVGMILFATIPPFISLVSRHLVNRTSQMLPQPQPQWHQRQQYQQLQRLQQRSLLRQQFQVPVVKSQTVQSPVGSSLSILFNPPKIFNIFSHLPSKLLLQFMFSILLSNLRV